MPATPIQLEVFDTQLKNKFVGMSPMSPPRFTSRANFSEVTVETLGGKVLSVSDDFFASKDNLIKPYVSRILIWLLERWLIDKPSVSMKGQFGPTGALYDAWESRRHNPSFDW
jgi:allantoicase